MDTLNTPPTEIEGRNFLSFDDKLIQRKKDKQSALEYRPDFSSDYTGGITSEDLFKSKLDYTKLNPIIVESLNWVQNFISQNKDSELLAKARAERGESYQKASALITNTLERYFVEKKEVDKNDIPSITSIIINDLIGLGPIEPLYQDQRITEIMVNGHDRVVVEINGLLIPVPGCKFRDEKHLLELCSQMLLNSGGRSINIRSPMEDGRLPDKSRINVVHESIGNHKNYLTIRRFREKAFSLEDLVKAEALTETMALELGQLIHDGCSTVVVGGTGSGKTTLLNALSGCIPNNERIVTIEDNIELRIHPDKFVSSLEARKGKAEDKSDEVTIRDLVKNALRMRPDRIIIGEVRDASAYDMLQAMNTGHDGSLTTVHANDIQGGIDRLINLMNESGEVDNKSALSLIAGGVDLIVNLQRFEDGSRRVVSIAEVPQLVKSENGTHSLTPLTLWEFEQTGTEPGTGKIVGQYIKVNNPSEKLIRSRRLDKRKQLTITEIYELSKTE